MYMYKYICYIPGYITYTHTYIHLHTDICKYIHIMNECNVNTHITHHK